MKVQRIYNNGSLGKERSISVDQVVFLKLGDKVPGEFIDYYLHHASEALQLVEIGCSSNEPGFIHKIVAIPKGTHINEKMVVVA